jgi:hypothetical protein
MKQIYFDVERQEWRAVDRVCACKDCSNGETFPECAVTTSCWCNRPATMEEIDQHIEYLKKAIATNRIFIDVGDLDQKQCE